jgi:hypothetical protein
MTRHVALACVSSLALSLTACGGGDDTGDDAAAAGGSESQAKQALKLGDETTLRGLGEESMKVKVIRVQDPLPLPPAKGLIQEKPRAGRRFVGVHVRLTNLGKETYEDSALNGSRLVTDVKDGANPTILLGGKCSSKRIGTRLRLAAGASTKGCLPFQVKKKAKVTAFEFRLDSGHGPEGAKWAVP